MPDSGELTDDPFGRLMGRLNWNRLLTDACMQFIMPTTSVVFEDGRSMTWAAMVLESDNRGDRWTRRSLATLGPGSTKAGLARRRLALAS
jgi:hypothetical protein